MSNTTFPPTAWSVIAARSDDTAERRLRMTRLFELYRKPVISYLRNFYAKQRNDADDLTQAFFAYILQGGVVEQFDPAIARFRTYLKTCLRHFVARNAGPRLETVPLPELEEYDRPAPPDDAFDREWIDAVFERAMAETKRILLADGQETAWKAFELYEIPQSRGDQPPTYAAVAQQVGATEHAVRRYLRNARALLKRLIVEDVRQTVANPEDVPDEVKFIFEA